MPLRRLKAVPCIFVFTVRFQISSGPRRSNKLKTAIFVLIYFETDTQLISNQTMKSKLRREFLGLSIYLCNKNEISHRSVKNNILGLNSQTFIESIFSVPLELAYKNTKI